jgi:hypothetical protein
MFQRCFAAIAPLLIAAGSAAALPQESDFREIDTIPQPDPAAFGVVGCSVPDGRYLLWDGNTVFVQRTVGSGVFDPVATGYAGDPGFAVLSFGGDFVLLGQGFGNGTTANVYPFDFNNPSDYQSGDEIVVPNHFSAAFLNSSLVAFDRGDFGLPAEIIVLDLFSTSRGATRRVAVMHRPLPISRDTIITKPSDSFSASIAVDGPTFYAADAGNGQYKSFLVSDLIDAFNSSGTVPWSSGTDIGGPFDFPLGGVSGVTASGNLVIAGFGAIVEVDPVLESVVTTFDPAGTGPFYGIVYNDATEDFIAVEFPPAFGDPLVYHATVAGVATLTASNGWTLSLLFAALTIAAIAAVFARRTEA